MLYTRIWSWNVHVAPSGNFVISASISLREKQKGKLQKAKEKLKITHLNLGSFQAEPEGPMEEKFLGKKEQKKREMMKSRDTGREKRSEKSRNREVAKEKEKLLF